MYNPSMRDAFGRQTAAFVLLLVLGAGVTLLSGVYTNFHVAGNDFWGVLYYGRHITLDHSESLYNGFFPIGYAFLIGQFPFSYTIQLAYLTNALLTGLFVASVSSLALASRSIPAMIFTLAASVLTPVVFAYSNTVGPDIGAAAFSAFAVYLMWKHELSGERAAAATGRPILIGIALGLAVLWRTHAVVMALSSLLVAFWLLGFQPRRSSLSMLVSFLAVVSAQIAANLLAGHGVFETAQGFNIYKLLYGVNWTYPPAPAEIAGFSLIEVLREEPRRVIEAYLPPFWSLAGYAWPGLACGLIAPRGPLRKFGLFSALVTLLYAAPLALGDSPRAALTIMGLFIPSLGLILAALRARLQLRSGGVAWLPAALTAGFLVLSVFPFYRWIVQDREFLQGNRAQNRVFRSIEQVLLARGVTSAVRVYADKYELYFPHILPYQARQIGGWSIEWLWGYQAEFPVLPNDTWESFRRASRVQGIEYLILSPQARHQGEFFGSIYADESGGEHWDLEFVAQRANMRIYRLK